jgi:hypothetical protein
MSDLWYPGRHPFCSEEVIDLLGHAIEALTLLVSSEDGTHLESLEGVTDAALITIGGENEECLGTDENLHSLYALFADTFKGAVLFYKGKAWRNIYELATNMQVARDQLIEAVEGATDNGRIISPEGDGGPRAGADGSTSSEQEDPPGTSEERQCQSEGALQGDAEEAQA